MVKTIAIVLALAGCDRWTGPEPLWTLEARHGQRAELRPIMYATAGLGGETIVGATNVLLGDRELVGPHIVRVGPQGDIASAAAVTDVGIAAPDVVGIDRMGRPVILWSNGGGGFWLVAFDENLATRWVATAVGRLPGAPYRYGAFAVGPSGAMAYAVMDGNGAVTLHYLTDDGTERWTATPGYVENVSVLDGGDVLAYGGGRRVRLAAATGELVEDIPGYSWAVASDGTAVAFELELGEHISYFEPDGRVRWRTRLDGAGVCAFRECLPEAVERSTLVTMHVGGDVLVKQRQTVLVRLDRDTGDEVGDVEHCHAVAPVASDAHGYVALGPTCDLDYALARYPAP